RKAHLAQRECACRLADRDKLGPAVKIEIAAVPELGPDQEIRRAVLQARLCDPADHNVEGIAHDGRKAWVAYGVFSRTILHSALPGAQHAARQGFRVHVDPDDDIGAAGTASGNRKWI